MAKWRRRKKADSPTLGPIMGPKARTRAMYQRLMRNLAARMRKDAEKRLAASAPQDLAAVLLELRVKWEPIYEKRSRVIGSWFAAESDKSARIDVRKMLEPYGLDAVSPYFEKAHLDTVKSVLRENVEMIRSVPRSYFDGIEKALTDSSAGGFMDLAAIHQALSPLVKERGKAMDRRIAAIARDQCSKAAGLLTRTRTLAAGIAEGVWIHSRAGREPRPGHLEAGVKKTRFNIADGLRQEYSDSVNEDLPVELLVDGDVKVYLANADMSTVARGMKIFYRQTNSAAAGQPSNAGELQAAAAGSTVAGFVESAWSVYKVLDVETGLVKASTYRKA